MASQEELAEVGGGDLEAGGGEVNIVVVGQDIEDGFFANGVGGEAFLVQKPEPSRHARPARRFFLMVWAEASFAPKT